MQWLRSVKFIHRKLIWLQVILSNSVLRHCEVVVPFRVLVLLFNFHIQVPFRLLVCTNVGTHYNLEWAKTAQNRPGTQLKHPRTTYKYVYDFLEQHEAIFLSQRTPHNRPEQAGNSS